MDGEQIIYGTVVKRTVMEDDRLSGSSCRHSSGTIHYIKKPGQWSHVMVVSVAFLTLGGSIPVGYICGTSTIPYHVEDAWVRLPMSTLRNLLLLGGVFGCGAAALLADWAGRRRTTVVGQLAGVIGAMTHLLATITHSQVVLVLAWVFLGLFIGVGASVLPLYMVELAPSPLRSPVGAIYSVGTAVGLMLSQTISLHCALGIETSSGHPFLVPIILIPLFSSWIFFHEVSESPVYLYFIKKDTTSAEAEMVRLRGTDIASVESELNKSVLNDESEDSRKSIKLLGQSSLKAVIMCAAHLSQALGESDQLYHLSGARPKLAEADVVAVGYTATVINCVVALMLVHLISVVSWRVLLITSCVNSSVLLLVMAAFAMQENASDQTLYLMLVTLLLQVVVFDMGLRPVPCFLACELFTVKTTAAMMALGSAVNFVGQFMSDQLFLFLGVAHFRFMAAIFLAISVVFLLISHAIDPKDTVSSEKREASCKGHSAVSQLPNPH